MTMRVSGADGIARNSRTTAAPVAPALATTRGPIDTDTTTSAATHTRLAIRYETPPPPPFPRV